MADRLREPALRQLPLPVAMAVSQALDAGARVVCCAHEGDIYRGSVTLASVPAQARDLLARCGFDWLGDFPGHFVGVMHRQIDDECEMCCGTHWGPEGFCVPPDLHSINGECLLCYGAGTKFRWSYDP